LNSYELGQSFRHRDNKSIIDTPISLVWSSIDDLSVIMMRDTHPVLAKQAQFAVILLGLLLLLLPLQSRGRQGPHGSARDEAVIGDASFYSGEWGALAPRRKVARRAVGDDVSWPPSFDTRLGIQEREAFILRYLNSSNNKIDQALVKDYFAEIRYEESDNVVVLRPEGNDAIADSPETRWAYENMKIRLRNTRYNDVRPGPKVYYMPKNASILSQIVKDLNEAGEFFVIRGGGHSYEANTLPSSDKAAVIDMAKFTKMEVSERDAVGSDGVAYRELTFGPGLRLATLYVFLAMENLALVAGTCPANGASGYYLGGGAGPSMRRMGWGSDQIIRAKVVLSDGSLAVADSDDEKRLPGQKVLPSELLYALRGGGAGTAIVYEYTLRVYLAPENVVRCKLSYTTQSKEAYQMFVNGWSNDWNIWKLDGQKYPFIRIYSRSDASYILMDSWDTSTEDLASEMVRGMSGAQSIQAGDPSCTSFSWVEFLYETFVSYYAAYPEIQENIDFSNFTNPSLLAMDYIGWGYAGSDLPGVSPPLSPYADFVAVAPTVNGPSSFSAQGILSSMPWNSEVAARLWDEALSKGLRFYSYALGGKLDDAPRGAAADDALGSAFDALSHGTILTVTDVDASDQVGLALSAAVADVLDNLTVSKQPSRYYNFLNCYNNTDSSILFDMYYGDKVAKKLVEVKTNADPGSLLKTWCNV